MAHKHHRHGHHGGMKKKGHHTGPVDHGDMYDHLKGQHDGHAHASHHSMNEMHDGAGAFNTDGEEHDKGQHHGKGKGMDCNEC